MVLFQSGLDEKWSAASMACHCYLRNIQDLLFAGKRPCERQFGQPFKGPIIPFGAVVEYHPVCAKDLSRLHQFGKKVMPGTFLRFALHAGGGSGKESFSSQTPMNGEKIIFPVADGQSNSLEKISF